MSPGTAAGAGGAAALDAADPWALRCWRTGLTFLATTGRTFTVDDVRALGVPELDHPCATGGLVAAWAAAGRIRPVGVSRSRRPTRHAGRVRLWVGCPAGTDVGEAAR